MKSIDIGSILSIKNGGLTIVSGEAMSGKTLFLKTILLSTIKNKKDAKILIIAENVKDYKYFLQDIVLKSNMDEYKSLNLNIFDTADYELFNFLEHWRESTNDFDLILLDGVNFERNVQMKMIRTCMGFCDNIFMTNMLRTQMLDNGLSFNYSHLAGCIVKIKKVKVVNGEFDKADYEYVLTMIKHRVTKTLLNHFIFKRSEENCLTFRLNNHAINFFNLPEKSIINYYETYLPVDSNILNFFKTINASKKIKKTIYEKTIIKLKDDLYFINYDTLLLAEIAFRFVSGNNGLMQKLLIGDKILDQIKTDISPMILDNIDENSTIDNNILSYVDKFIADNKNKSVVNFSSYNRLVDVPKLDFINFIKKIKYCIVEKIFNSTNDFYLIRDTISMYSAYVNAYGDNIEFNQSNIMDIHNYLQNRVSEIKYNHISIENQRKICKINGCLLFDEFVVKVPVDHKSIVENGNLMNICVGATISYFEKIKNGDSFILFLMKNDNPFVCIELSTDLMITQIKGIKNKEIESDFSKEIYSKIIGILNES